MRLRTLPLSVAGIVVGSMASYGAETFSWSIMVLAVFTVLALQTVSNLANELGDALKLADSHDRQGPKHGILAGKVTKKEIAILIGFFTAISIIAGLSLIAVSFGGLFTIKSISFIAFGALCIVAAVGYTLGKKPYGYMRLGDVAVFIFFGLMSVMGANYLQCKTLESSMLLPAISIGALSVAVLNINNMRDMQSDERAKKLTIALWLGARGARIYQSALILVAVVSWGMFDGWWIAFFIPIFGYHVYKCFTMQGKELDSQLPLISFTTIAITAIYTAITVIYC